MTLSHTIAVDERLALGGQMTKDELRELAAAGFKSIIDLRTGDEPEPPMNREEEAEEARHLGLIYHNLPVQGNDIKPGQVDRYAALLGELTAPIYVHCQKGQRAAAVSMLHLAAVHGWSGEEALKKADELGCPLSPAIRQSVRNYIAEQTDVG